MALIGPIKPKFSDTPNTVPFVTQQNEQAPSGMYGDPSYPAAFNELIANGRDGRLWLRKSQPIRNEILNDPSVLFKYNYEQIGGPYVIVEKTGGHTLIPEDSARILEMNVSSSTQITIPSYTGSNAVPFVKGTEVKILLTNNGSVNITGAPGVTLNSKNGFNLTSQWGMASLIKRGTDSWVITGDLS